MVLDMKVSVEKEIANILSRIANILSRWNETSAEIFIKKAQSGIYTEAENDAIDLRQLLIEEKKLTEVLESLPGE